MNRKLAALVVVASLCLAAASTAGAARAAAVCPSFKQGGRTYQWETLGSSWTCKSAKAWVVKLIGDPIHKLHQESAAHERPAWLPLLGGAEQPAGPRDQRHVLQRDVRVPGDRLCVVRGLRLIGISPGTRPSARCGARRAGSSAFARAGS